MSLSMSLSPTNAHTSASSCPRQEHEHPSSRGHCDTNLRGQSLDFHSISACFSFPFKCSQSAPPRFPRCSRKVMRTSYPVPFSFGVECQFALMYVHVLRLLCFLMPCINVYLVRIQPFISREAAFNSPRGPQLLSSRCSVSVRTLSYS